MKTTVATVAAAVVLAVLTGFGVAHAVTDNSPRSGGAGGAPTATVVPYGDR